MNNSTAAPDCEALRAPGWPRVLLETYTGSVLVLGLLLNGAALWVLCRRLPRWTEARVYMANLAAADLCLLTTLPFVLHTLRRPAPDTLLCRLSQSVYLANRYLSIGLVTAIAADRYLALRHPLWARRLRSPRRAAGLCAALWLLVLAALAARWLLGAQEGGFCFASPDRPAASSTLVFSLLGFFLPLAALLFCSLHVLAALARRPAGDAGQAKATRKAARMVCANLVVFTVCFLPLHVVLALRAARAPPSCALTYALVLAGRLSDANCCLDAVCYYFAAREFREAAPGPAPPDTEAAAAPNTVCMTLA